ncbi:hypothetical protein HD554DRAFT_2028542, partial [Boletus coccyginus]
LRFPVVSCTFHAVAIACTVFRLMYRWYMTRLWWDDGWAAFALPVDVFCLVAASLEVPAKGKNEIPSDTNEITDWMVAMGFPCVLWACRTSILFSIVRVVPPSRLLRCIAILVGCSFLIMWAALMGQKIEICLESQCKIAGSVGLSQLITDVISDAALVVLPIYLLRGTGITHRQRIMIYAAFSAALLITAVTILHSVMLFTAHSTGIVVIGHVKTALSLIVCNLLVIVAFTHRMCNRDGDPEERDSLTSVDLNTGITESAADKYTTTVVQHSMVLEMSSRTTTRTVDVEEAEGSVESK